MRPEFLRDHATGPDGQRRRGAAEAELAAARAGADTARLARALLRAGETCRILGDYNASVLHQEEAIQLALTPAKSRLARLALATTLQYRDEHERAVELFRNLLDEIRETPERTHEDYVLQHFGKCLAEMGRLDEATDLFGAALRLRESAGSDASGLVESSRRALATAREWMSGER